jgi:8-oxo-dGTP diphosphatase
MHVRQMTTAYLFHESDVLMIKHSSSRVFNFEFWSGVGGHIEPEEINDPKAAALREIYEESGLMQQEIKDFSLRYILLRLKDDEIRQQYIYFGRTDRKDLISSEEGELFWIKQEDLAQLHMSTLNRLMLEDYFRNPDCTGVKVGTITAGDNGEPYIQWAELKDPMMF